jgi:hypothetical protein
MKRTKSPSPALYAVQYPKAYTKGLSGSPPARIPRCWIEIEGQPHPIKQVVMIGLGAMRLDFHSQETHRAIRRLEFESTGEEEGVGCSCSLPVRDQKCRQPPPA